jgi:crossover junction endodeoxyribonuclease RuvC
MDESSLSKPETIMGVDPGLSATGYALLSLSSPAPRMLDGGVITTSEGDELAQRLAHIYEELKSILSRHYPQIIAVEGLFSQYRHPATAILMGHARGIVLLSAEEYHIPVKEYPPATIKQAVTGNGRASKEQVQKMVTALLTLEPEHLSEHTSDALACALTYLIREDRFP